MHVPEQADMAALRLALERELALRREIDHRVKNNFQLVASLLVLQARRSESPAARDALRAMNQRVTAISVLHRQVYREDGAEWVDAAVMVRELVGDLTASAGRDGVRVSMSLDPVILPAAQGAPLALVAGELVGNALAHGFPEGRPGVVTVTLDRTADGFELMVADDGVGFEGDAPRGFGLTIVQLFVQQLRGRLEVNPAQPGVRALVSVTMSPTEPAPA